MGPRMGANYRREVGGRRAVSCQTDITSDADGLPEVVQDGQGGRVVPNRSIDGFVNAIRELAADPESLKRMQTAAVDWARTQFAEERITEKYVHLYRHLVAATVRH